MNVRHESALIPKLTDVKYLGYALQGQLTFRLMIFFFARGLRPNETR